MHLIDTISKYSSNCFHLTNKVTYNKTITRTHKKSYKWKYNYFMKEMSDLQLDYHIHYNWLVELVRVNKYNMWSVFRRQRQYTYYNCEGLTSIPKEICKIKNILSLHIDGNYLQNIPDELFQLTKLQSLHTQKNQIKYISKKIGKLTELTILTIWSNKLKCMPKGLYKLINMVTLDVSNNLIKSVSPKIKSLTNLKKLYLDDNCMRYIPKEISELPNLKYCEFNVPFNKLRDIPKQFGERRGATVKCSYVMK